VCTAGLAWRPRLGRVSSPCHRRTAPRWWGAREHADGVRGPFRHRAHAYSLGFYEIIRANPGSKVWLPGGHQAGAPVEGASGPPVQRRSLVLNLPEHRLVLLPNPASGEHPVVITYPLSIGNMDCSRRWGETHVIAKITPTRPGSTPRVDPQDTRRMASGCPKGRVPSGPDNPPRLTSPCASPRQTAVQMLHVPTTRPAVGMAVTPRVHSSVSGRRRCAVLRWCRMVTHVATGRRSFEGCAWGLWSSSARGANPPVDAEGKSMVEPGRAAVVIGQKLDQALGQPTRRIFTGSGARCPPPCVSGLAIGIPTTGVVVVWRPTPKSPHPPLRAASVNCRRGL